MDSDQFVKFILFKNPENKYINISFGEAKTPRGLFCILINILTQCIIQLYGENVDIDKIEKEKMQLIIDRLHYTGVELRIDLIPNPRDTVGIFMVIDKDDSKLENFALHILSPTILYIIRFGLFHNNIKRCKTNF